MRNLSEEHLNEKKKKGFVPFQKGVNPFAKKEKNSEEDKEDSKDSSKGGNPFAKGGSLHAKGQSAKKKKIGKMKVACEKCDTPISNLTESRDQFRLKLRGFCESCNKFKVAYINDMNAIAASGKRFDYLVKENLPAGVAQPGLPANANSQQQKPAAPGTTTTTPAPAPNPAQLLQKPEVQAAASAFAKIIGHTTKDLHQMLTTDKNLTNTPPAVAPAPKTPTTTAAPTASAAPTGQVPPTTQVPK